LCKLEVERDDSKLGEELLPNKSLVHRWVKQLDARTPGRGTQLRIVNASRLAVACMNSGSADTVIIPIALQDHADMHAV
jgi:hypothetical protein